jgi:membrane protease YdiL (CAAX protease family)
MQDNGATTLEEHREPFKTDCTPECKPTSREVPVARPIAVCHARPIDLPGTEMLLQHGSTAAQALMDVGILIVAFCAVEAVRGGFFLVLFDGEPDIRQVIVPSLAIRLVAVVIVISLILKRRGLSPHSVGVTARGLWVNLPLGALAAALAGGLNLVVMTVLIWFWPGLLEQMNQNVDQITALFPKMHPLSTAGVMLMVGMWEELFFRGFLMTRVRRATSSWTLAVLISTAAFVVLHALDQTPAAMIPITILSLVFSMVTIWRRSIIPAILAHVIYDLTVLIFLGLTTGDAWV